MPVVSIPNIGDVTFPDEMSQNDILRAIEEDILPNYRPPKESSVVGELGRGVKQLVSSTRTGLGAIVNPEEAAREGLARSREIDLATGEGPSLEAVKRAFEREGVLAGAKEAVSQIPRAVAGQAGNIGAVLGGAALGTAMAGPIGGLVGAGAALFPSYVGSNVERQAQEQLEKNPEASLEIDRANALLAATGQSALDVGGVLGTLGKKLTMSLLKLPAKELGAEAAEKAMLATAEKSLGRTVAEGAVRGTVAEMPTEMAQQVLERWQAGLSLTDDDAMKEYGQTLYQTALVGPALGGLANVQQRASARGKIQEQQAFEAAKARELEQDAALKARQEAQAEEEAKAKAAAPAEAPAVAPVVPALPTPATPITAQGPVAPAPTAPVAPAAPPAPTVEPAPAPTTGVVTLENLKKWTPIPTGQRAWANANLVGKTVEEMNAWAAEQLATNPKLNAAQRRILTDLAPSEVTNAVNLRTELGGSEPSVGTPRPAVITGRPSGEGVAASVTPAQPEAPVARAVEPAGGPVGPGVSPEEPSWRTLKKGPWKGIPFTNVPWAQIIKDAPLITRPRINEIQSLNTKVAGLEVEIEDLARVKRNLLPDDREGHRRLNRLIKPLEDESQKLNTQIKGLFTPLQKSHPNVAQALETFKTQTKAVERRKTTPTAPVDVAVRPGPTEPTATEQARLQDERRLTQEAVKPPPGIGETKVLPIDYGPSLQKPEFREPISARPDELGGTPIVERGPQGELFGISTEQAARKFGVRDEAAEMRRAEGMLLGGQYTQLRQGEQDVAAAKAQEAAEATTRKELGQEYAQREAQEEMFPEDRTLWGIPEIQGPPAPGSTKPYKPRKSKLKVMAEGPITEPAQRDKRTAQEITGATPEQMAAVTTVAKIGKSGVKKVKLGRHKETAADEQSIGYDFFNDKPVYQTEDLSGAYPLPGEMIDQIARANPGRALNHIAYKSENVVFRAIARRVIPLTGGVKVTIIKELKDPKGVRIAGGVTADGRQVWLDSEFGLNEETLLHEMVHAVTVRLLAAPERMLTAVQLHAKRELEALYNELGSNPGIPLSDAGRASLIEFVTEGMTKPDVITALQKTPWTWRTAWEDFKRSILQMLNITAPKTQFDHLVASMDTLFKHVSFSLKEPGPLAHAQQISPQTQATLNALQARYSAMAPGGFMGRIFQNTGTDIVTQIRSRIVDNMAAFSDKASEHYVLGIRSALGKLSPELLMRQAQAPRKLVTSFYQHGKLEFDNTIGSYRVTDGEIAPQKVLDLLKDWATAQNKSIPDAKVEAGRILEAVRLRELRANAPTVSRHMRDSEIDTLCAHYDNDPILQEITRVMDAPRHHLIDLMVQVGRISAEEGQMWKDAIGYIPFDRVEGLFNANPFRQQRRTGRGLAQLGQLPELRGSLSMPVKNAFDNYFQILSWMIQQSVQQHATQSGLNWMVNSGMATMHNTNRNIPADRMVPSYVNGEQKFYDVNNPYFALAFTFKNIPLPGIFGTMAKFSNVLRTSVTAFPLFSAKQIMIDPQRAIIESGVKDSAALLKRIATNFATLSAAELRGRGEQTSIIQRMGRLGIVGQVDWMSNNPAQTFMQEMGIDKQTLMGSTIFAKLVHRADAISRASDIAVREAVYHQTRIETQDEALAVHRARELINFQRRGAGWGTGPLGGGLDLLIQTVPFFNATLQGMDVLYRTFRKTITGQGLSSSGVSAGRARSLFITQAGMYTAFASIYALMMSGDDEYDRMGLRERDSSWMLGGGAAIPVPTEIGMIFKSIPESIVEYYKRKGTPQEQIAMEAITSYFRRAAETYWGGIVPIPQAVRPVLENISNHSFLTGRELEGTHQQGILPHLRETGNTTEFAKAVAKHAAQAGVEISPIHIDNVFNGYLGMTAGATTLVADALMNPGKADRPFYKMVGVAAFSYDPVGTRYLDEFYDMREKVIQIHNSVLDLQKRDPAEAVKLIQENKEKFAMASLINQELKFLQTTRMIKNMMEKGEAEGVQNLSPTERRERIDKLHDAEQKKVQWLREVKAKLGIY